MAYQAAILCGGLGTRLRARLGDIPKSVAPVHGKPFLWYLAMSLKAQGILDILLLVGYKGEHIHRACGDGSQWGVRLVYSCEDSPLGTAGGLKNAASLLTEAFLLLNGDTLLECRYADLLERHRASGALLTVTARRVPDAGRYGSILCNPAGWVTGFAEKAEAGREARVNAGVYAVSPGLLARIPQGQAASLEREVIPEVIAQGGLVRAHPVDGYFCDIGEPVGYDAFCRDVASGAYPASFGHA